MKNKVGVDVTSRDTTTVSRSVSTGTYHRVDGEIQRVKNKTMKTLGRYQIRYLWKNRRCVHVLILRPTRPSLPTSSHLNYYEILPWELVTLSFSGHLFTIYETGEVRGGDTRKILCKGFPQVSQGLTNKLRDGTSMSGILSEYVDIRHHGCY